ncbi:MAG: hypothetical protein KBC30_02190 [Planctomycetes bacterium]|nr:hypothetical protein [Planctomycetota bacterium]
MRQKILYLIYFSIFLNIIQGQVILSPSKIEVYPQDQVAFTVAYKENGELQPVWPFDFTFSAPEGECTGNVFVAPEKPGTYKVYAQYKEHRGVALVIVKEKPLTRQQAIQQRLKEKRVRELQQKRPLTPLERQKQIELQKALEKQKQENLKLIEQEKQIAFKRIEEKKLKFIEEKQKSIEQTEQQLEEQLKEEQLMEQPMEQPMEEPVEQPVQPVTEPMEQPVAEPMEQPVAEPMEQPIEEPMEQPIEEPMEQPIEEPMEQPIEEPMEQPIEEPMEESVEQPVEEPMEQPVEEPMKEPIEEPMEQPIEEPMEESVEQPVTETAYKLVVKPHEVTVEPNEKIRFEVALYHNGKEEWRFPWEYTFIVSQGNMEDTIYTAPQEPGTYEIIVRHSEATCKAIVHVREKYIPKLVKIQVEPQNIEMESGTVQPIKIIGLDEKNNPVKGNWKWDFLGGTLDINNNYHAGNIPGKYMITVTDKNTNISTKIPVLIKERKILYTIQTTPEKIQIQPKQQQKIDIRLFKNNREQWTWEWEFTIVAEKGQIKGSTYIAPDTAGKDVIKISYHQDQFTKIHHTIEVEVLPTEQEQIVDTTTNKDKVVDTITDKDKVADITTDKDTMVTSEDPQKNMLQDVQQLQPIPPKYPIPPKQTDTDKKVADRLTMDPRHPKLRPNQQIKFKIRGYNRNSPVPVHIQWTATGGTIDDNGVYTAGTQTGTFMLNIVDTRSNRKDSTSIIITEKEISEETYSYISKTTAYDKPTTPQSEYEIPKEPYEIPSTQPTENIITRYKAYVPPIHIPQSVDNAKKPMRILVQPVTAQISMGEEVQFKAIALNLQNQQIQIPIQWKATGGTISSTGLFKAGFQSGRYQISAYSPDYANLYSIATVYIIYTLQADGRAWANLLKTGKSSQEHLINYITEDLFYKSIIEISQFRQGFVANYPKGPQAYQSIWIQSIQRLAKEKSQDLYYGNITQAELQNFFNRYIKRLPYQDQQIFINNL